MLIIEAFRQTFLAVTEAYFPFAEGVDTFFVIDDMSQSFNHFVFPLPATIHYSVEVVEINKRRSRHSAHLSLTQNDVVCAFSDVSFSVYPAEVIAAKEARDSVRFTRNRSAS